MKAGSRRGRLPPILLLAFGLVCLSQAGNLVRLAQAPILAIAFYRLVGGAAVLAPIGLPQLWGVRDRRALWAMTLGGLLFGAHFVAWFYGVKHTLVANAMLLFCANPVFAALGGALVLGERVGGRTWFAIALGLLGIAVTTGGDLLLGPDRLAGNLAALGAGIFFAGYVVAGRFFRRKIGVWGAFTGTLGVAGVVVAVLVAALRVPLLGYPHETWVVLGLLVLLPTLLGHGIFNHAMRRVKPAVLSGLTLTEPLLGGLVAWFLFHEAVTSWSWAGYVLIALSAILLLRVQLGEPEIP
jgi:drug/metabolite transporter (DMT)-like permease